MSVCLSVQILKPITQKKGQGGRGRAGQAIWAVRRTGQGQGSSYKQGRAAVTNRAGQGRAGRAR